MDSTTPDALTRLLQTDLPATEDFVKQLADYCNYLIEQDFEKLIQLLYRIDVDESKIKKLLKTSDQEAGAIIARLLIERQQQKRSGRDEGNSAAISEEERW